MRRALRAAGSALLLVFCSALQAAAPRSESELSAVADSLYAASAAQRLWTLESGRASPAADAVIAELLAARQRGLDPADYDATLLQQSAVRLEANPSDVPAFERALTQAVLRFVVHLGRGRVLPREAGHALAARRTPPDLAATVRALARGDTAARVLDAQEPHYRHFVLLKQALQRYLTLAAAGPDVQLPALHRRVRQIELAMERVRWLPPPPDGPFIVVNIPQFRLYAFRGPGDAEQAMTAMNVIVGKTYPRFRTPVFAADLRQVVFRPYWDVPASILRNELLPALRRDPHLAEREGYEAVRGQRDDSPVVPWSPESIEALASGGLRLRQRPGPKNALGGVKFLLPNPHDVYLHSTPAQGLFRQSRRAFSHGCVRVEDPVALARFVFADDPTWDEARIRASMQDGVPSERIRLVRSIPVVIFYATAVATEDGRVLFLEDLYGHDRRLEALLARPR